MTHSLSEIMDEEYMTELEGKLSAANERIATLIQEKREMEEALKEIIEIDQLEKKTVTDVDPAGCTYAVTKVDGWCAAVARRAQRAAPAFRRERP